MLIYNSSFLLRLNVCNDLAKAMKALDGKIFVSSGATLPIPGHLPRTKEAPVQDIALTAPAPGTEPTRSPEEEARDIIATAAKNQAEDGPNKEGSSPRMQVLKGYGQPI